MKLNQIKDFIKSIFFIQKKNVVDEYLIKDFYDKEGFLIEKIEFVRLLE